jgi:hypothetical protein
MHTWTFPIRETHLDWIGMPDDFDPSAIVDPTLQRLYGYWNERRAARAMPARADIDPLDLGFILGHLVLAEVLGDPPRFLIRVHGTEITQRVGYELTGKVLDELPQNDFRRLTQQSFTTVVETGVPIHRLRDRVLDGKRLQYETLILPLSKSGTAVDMLLVGLRYKDA